MYNTCYCVVHQKRFFQSIRRTKEQQSRLQCLAWAMQKSVMPSGAMNSAKLLRTKSTKIWQSGLVLSQFDWFLLIGPRAKGGPTLRQLTNTNLHFASKLILNIFGAGPSVFQVGLRDQNGSQIIPTVSQNSLNSLYYHHQNTRKPCFIIISVFRQNSCGLSKCLCRQQGQI